MRLHNFFIEQKIGEAKEVRTEDTDLLHQLKNVFRLQKGDEIIFLDNSGWEYRSKVDLLSKNEGVFEVLEAKENSVTPIRNISMCVSMIKKDNFEWVLLKGTELGVSSFTPIISERSIKTNFNHERGLKIIKEASEQSGRGKMPILNEMISLENTLEDIKKNNLFAVAFHLNGKKFSANTTNPSLNNQNGVTVFIGPEGGWSEKEITLFQKYDVEVYSLGGATLRAETASIAVATLLLL